MISSSVKRLQAFFELFTAATIWGFGFVATIWALKSVDPITLSLIRFGVAFIIGWIGFRIYEHWIQNKKSSHLHHFKIAFWPGLFLALTIGLQSWGLETTSATNSGFITTLYVVIVPIFEKLMFKKHLPKIHYFWVLVALLGTGLMIEVHLEAFKSGDFLTLLCAFFAAAQIVWIGKIQTQIHSPFLFNTFQSFWAAAGSLLLLPFYGQLYFTRFNDLAIVGLLSVTLGSTLIAFALQIRAQKTLSPSIASIVFLMESPFAAIFAFALLHEELGPLQALGGALIFVAAIGATFTEKRT